MKITLLTPGSCKHAHYAAAQADLLQKISRITKVELIEVKEVNPKSKSQIVSCKEQEAELLVNKIPAGAIVIALDEHGKQLNALQWGSLIERQIDIGQNICFVIGGTNGLSAETLARAQRKIALGKCTLTQDLARITLLECVFRGLTIAKGLPFHR